MFRQNGHEMIWCVFGSITRRLRPSEAKTVCRTMQDGYKPLTLLNSAC
jgi:hypothetical protein